MGRAQQAMQANQSSTGSHGGSNVGGSNNGGSTNDPLQSHIRQLEARLAEAEETLEALRNGEVDAVIASSPEGDRVYTLRGADETYRIFLEQMAEGALTLLADGLIAFSNEQFAWMVGIPLERVIGSKLHDFVVDEDGPALTSLLARAREGSQKQEFRLNGSDATVPVYIAVNFFRQDTVDCLCAIVTNLTEQKKTEQIVASERLARALLNEREKTERVVAESEYRLRMAADLAGFSAYEWDANTSELSWDARLKAMWGLSPEETVTQETFLACIHPEDRPAVDKGIAGSLDPSGDGLYAGEFRVMGRDDGQERWVSALGRTFFRNGHGERFIGGVQDITVRKRIERELRQANADLQQFAYSASHDLQEPLRAISIYSELLVGRHGQKLDGEARNFLEFLRTGALRMEMLVRDLLAYTQAANTDSPAAETDTNEALSIALLNLGSVIAESGTKVAHGLLPAVRVPKSHLQQLFQNLIGNAVKYRSKEQPVIDISAEKRDTHWLFSVRDNGMGIDSKHHDKIFGLFKRLHTGDEYAGTGIGLAICQRIVERHQGRIWVESEPGNGSTFYFSFPV